MSDILPLPFNSHVISSSSMEEKPGPPHEALFLVLSYLPLYELLNMNRVCISLRDAVKNDLLVWLSLIVDRPLSSRLTDEILMKITSKANGKLRCLGLINCMRITDDGLLRVIGNNPHIKKLYLAGCTALTPDGIIRALEVHSKHHHHNKNNHHHLRVLHINGIYNITKEHLLTLRSYLKPSNSTPNQTPKRLYHWYRKSPLTFINVERDDAHGIIDVEICPRCNEVDLVFDCPREICKKRCVWFKAECRGCKICIPRCVECGGCVVSEEDMEEAVCLDVLCSECWLKLPKCNFCNKPYCSRHADLRSSSSHGFLCDFCRAKHG